MIPYRQTALVLGMTLWAATAGAQMNHMEGGQHTMQPPASMGGDMALHPGARHGMAMDGMNHQMPMHGMESGMPQQAGQAAFGAAQEIVAMLQADPKTDWSKVDIDALRQHLIDMDEVTLHADVSKTTLDNGLSMAVTGSGRTLQAIQRMLPAHARDIDGLNGWRVQATPLPNGETLTVTSMNAADLPHIRGLGFMGIMVQGTHQMHHLAMARGEMHMP